ncbi:Cu2+-exporting ATPase [Rhodovulum sulfidophilum]|uniref:heavy metal translocating P-type ATPase n=1 Tax=Rhodovulum sulfidophilum TaxID=35806 RepID=UPI0005A88541|nr:heavy metal translocating P-type ATPase [Rhodovulum sulfidophilum]ANB33643.1 ATPase [Rhodovulum sulfidophilum DSM 1374]ANB37464.1 ATPase [Rhodovulum sulfidophilum]MCW2303016.1 Cu2+-exporting ATPase [Rhodovulum sulfidophilum]
MSAEMQMRPAACPACAVAPSAETLAAAGAAAPKEARLFLSLPTIHCAACISAVERALNGTAGVLDARVNLTLKRVAVEAGPEVTADRLIEVLAAIGYEAHELDPGVIAATATDRAGRDILMRLAVSGFAMMNVMLLSVAVWSGAADATRDLFHWVSAMIALPTIVFAAQPFFRNAFAVLRHGRLNMDVPISLAIVLAAGMSLYETAQHGPHAYFDAALSLTFFLLAGRYLDHRTRAVARSAAEELAALEVPRAQRRTGAGEETVPIAEIAVGDVVLVRPGGRVPVDGVVAEGQSEIDRSLLTGETLPAFAGPGMALSAGEVNLTGPLAVTVTAAGQDSSLHRMADLVAVAESSRNRYTSLADRAARIYAPGVHLLSLLAFLVWLWISGGDLRLALNIAVAVLIITCPCALGLAVPAVTTAASGRLFRRGLLIKDGTALERLAEIDAVVFDKTGTLTLGAPEPTNLGDHPRRDLEIALALAEGSAHPLARALAEAARQAGLHPARVSDIREVPGYGVEGALGGETVRFGRAAWVGAGAAPGSETASWLRVGARAPVTFTFADRLRPGAETAVAELVALGMKVRLVSGDAPGPVADLAARLGISDWQAEALPEDKAAAVQALGDEGRRVLMVGDGLNDTAALAAAHVSISPASALDAARVASDIVLLGRDLAPLGGAVATARRATRRIRENFAISALYNMIAVPVALVGLATPLAAALAMSASSITVSLNALRLR